MSKIQRDYQNWHIGVFFLKIFTEVAYGHFLPNGIEIELIFALRAAVSEIWADFQNYHIWA